MKDSILTLLKADHAWMVEQRDKELQEARIYRNADDAAYAAIPEFKAEAWDEAQNTLLCTIRKVEAMQTPSASG